MILFFSDKSTTMYQRKRREDLFNRTAEAMLDCRCLIDPAGRVILELASSTRAMMFHAQVDIFHVVQCPHVGPGEPSAFHIRDPVGT
jgi:hypothetical protein